MCENAAFSIVTLTFLLLWPYREENQSIEAAKQKQRFLSHMLAQVQSNNTEERIQAHLIKMVRFPFIHLVVFLNSRANIA